MKNGRKIINATEPNLYSLFHDRFNFDHLEKTQVFQIKNQPFLR